MLVLSDFLVLGAILFCLSVAGIFINRKNVIILLMCIELMLLAVNMNFIAFSHFSGDIAGQVFVFFILTVAAAESAIGLAILPAAQRSREWDEIDTICLPRFSRHRAKIVHRANRFRNFAIIPWGQPR
jgi:NADH-quinone oxidoreductase subunit K